MLMANSVEGRFPFLDKDVVDLANRLPGRHKLLGLDEKYLLKQAFADLVPDEILHRPKQPYRAPDAAQFFFAAAGRTGSSEVTSPEALAAAGVFEPRPVAGAAREVPPAPAAYEHGQHRQHAGSRGAAPPSSSTSSFIAGRRRRRGRDRTTRADVAVDLVQTSRSTA